MQEEARLARCEELLLQLAEQVIAQQDELDELKRLVQQPLHSEDVRTTRDKVHKPRNYSDDTCDVPTLTLSHATQRTVKDVVRHGVDRLLAESEARVLHRVERRLHNAHSHTSHSAGHVITPYNNNKSNSNSSSNATPTSPSLSSISCASSAQASTPRRHHHQHPPQHNVKIVSHKTDNESFLFPVTCPTETVKEEGQQHALLGNIHAKQTTMHHCSYNHDNSNDGDDEMQGLTRLEESGMGSSICHNSGGQRDAGDAALQYLLQVFSVDLS